jgi:membrane associated rhomboid family serine protease
MAGIIDEIKDTYKNGNSLIKLIFINCTIFVLFRVVFLFYFFTDQAVFFPITNWMSMPSTPMALLFKPWTIITYMFYHEDVLHFLFNMLNLYWFGKIFLVYFDEKKLVSVYLLGGFVGGLMYFALYNIFPAAFHPAILMGASAAIIAIMTATAIYAPNFRLYMVFFGEVKLIYIAIFSVVLFIILIASDNPGGNLAHLGGALLGFLWAKQYMKGHELTKGISQFLESVYALFKSRKLKVTYKRPPVNDLDYNKQKLANQKEVDQILDKISKGGYESLSKEEKETLFKMSNKT